MNKNRFVKELKDYFSIFASFLIIFVLFSNNMSFAAASCSDIGDFTKREHCRDYGEKPFTVGSVDMDGNRPITCKGVSLDYNPYTSDDYYYDSSNTWCLAWALSISISYSALSVSAGFACTVAGAPAQIGPLTEKMTKLEKLRKAFDVIKKVSQGTVQVAQVTALSALTNPVIALQADFAIDAVTIGTILGINIATCAGSLGTTANACTSAAICSGMLAALAAASQTLIFATTGGLYETAKDQINKVKVCGYDWNTYAYTEYDMQQPENEWYPQYGSFSNSYSYAVNKIIKGEYSCVKYLKDDNGGKDNVELNAYAKECSLQSSSCKNEINTCIDRQKKKNYGLVKIDECLVDGPSCSRYCKGYFAKCEPIIGILDDGDGVCKDNNGSLYDKDNDKDLFKCKNVKSNNKNARNKFYRESIYKGKEFKISTKYTDSTDCIDPRLDEKKGYAGLEQRYYFRGKEAAQYACSRFKYTNNGCRLSDGTVITQEEAAADPTKDLKCRQAFQDANSCCQNRRALGICIYNSSGDKSDRDNNALCMRSLDGKADNCGLNTGHINNPKFVAYSSEVDSTQICVKNVNYCPYTYNVFGGTELQELYCAGDNNCTNCVKETGDKDDEWEGIKYRDSKGKIKEEYRYTVPLCSDKDTIWKKYRYKYPTMAYGNIKNFCRYRAHCTEIGESDYEFTDMTGNKFLPKVCSDFVGDSQNLPYPVKVADISMAGSVKSIIRSSGVNIGDGSLNSLYSAIDSMNTQQLTTVYTQIMAERAIISLAIGMVGGSFTGPLAGILTSAAAGTLYTVQDVKNAVESDGNAKTTLKAIVRDIVNKPLFPSVDFSLGEYRGFTAPIAQCIKETLSNMFLNKAGQSICAKEGEGVNSEGLCGNDTFGPPENIRKDAYIQMVGEQLPEDSNIFYKIQTRLQTIIKIVAALAIFVIGLKFLMKGDLNIFDIKKPKALIVGVLKFAIVFYFAVGNAWQSQFYEWVDKATQYIYYKSFNLSLVGYQDYKNQADKTTCKVVTRSKSYDDYDIINTENNKLIENLSEIPSPMPTTSEEICKTYLEDTDKEYQQCYSECKTGPAYDENGNQIFDYSDTYDGCYFGDNVYPEGKSYLAIFDSLDCKLMNYFGYGPDVDLPGILHMLLISLIFSPLAVVTVILGSILFVILLVIVIKILYLFLMTMIAINIMIYVSPIIFPTLLFEKYKGVFTKWLDNLLSFCLQFVFVIIFAGFLIGNLDRFAIGSARWVGHDQTTGRLPTLVCGDAADSIVCIFQVNTNKGTKPMLGEKISKFLGIGPIVSLVDSISKDFSGTVMTLLKFCLITYVLLEFLKKIPGVAAELTNGIALDSGQLDVKEIMDKIKDTTETVTRGTTGVLKKGVKSLGGLKEKVGEAKDKIKEVRAAGEAINDEKIENKGENGDKNGGGLERLGVKKQDSGSTPKPPVTPPTSSN